MTPFYRSPDGAVIVYCARWEDVHAAGLLPVSEIARLHAAPAGDAPVAGPLFDRGPR